MVPTPTPTPPTPDNFSSPFLQNAVLPSPHPVYAPPTPPNPAADTTPVANQCTGLNGVMSRASLYYESPLEQLKLKALGEIYRKSERLPGHQAQLIPKPGEVAACLPKNPKPPRER